MENKDINTLSDEEREELYKAYKKYTRSKYWKEEIRPAVLARDENRCVCCGRETDLTVHHSTYSILYRELEGDNLKYLVTICKYCHNSIHKCKSNIQRFKMDKASIKDKVE